MKCAALKDARIKELEECEKERREDHQKVIAEAVELAAQNEALKSLIIWIDTDDSDRDFLSQAQSNAIDCALNTLNIGAEILRKHDAQVLRKAGDYFIEKYALSGDALEHHTVVELDKLADALEKGE